MKMKNKRHLFRTIAMVLCLCMVCPFLTGMTAAASDGSEEPPDVDAVELIVLSEMEDEDTQPPEEAVVEIVEETPMEEPSFDEPDEEQPPEPDVFEDGTGAEPLPELTEGEGSIGEEPEPVIILPVPEETEEPYEPEPVIIIPEPEEPYEPEEPAIDPVPDDEDTEPDTPTPVYAYELNVSGGEGWFNAPVIFQIRINDLTAAGWAKVEASDQEDGERTDLTEMLLDQGYANYTVAQNGTIFVFVTDLDGAVHMDTFSVSCFDYDGPVVRAGVNNTVLHVEAIDLLSGVQGIIVNDKLYTTLENGMLNLPIEGNTTDPIFEIRALDSLQNESELSVIFNPFYQETSETHDEHCPPDCDCRKDTTEGADTTPTTPAPQTQPAVTQPVTTPQPTVTQAAVETPVPTASPQKTEEPTVTEAPITIEPGAPFTTNGDAVTRDLLYDKYTNKQFIVVETRNGETFYLVIDYDKPLDEEGERYETYFLNLVDEADLLALVDDGTKTTAAAPVCTCTDKCEIGHINTDCEVCRTNMSECIGRQTIIPTVEPEPEPEPTPETEPLKENNAGPAIVLIVLLLAAAGGGALYWFKFRKNKPKTKGPIDLDDYDYGEDEDSDEEYVTEPDDSDASDTDTNE